jgi:hypothetical protein
VNGGGTSYQSYNWIIDWGDEITETISGTGSNTGTISHTYTDDKLKHIIRIRPNGQVTQGWFNAFGCSISSSISNVGKIIRLNSQITEVMRTMAAYSHYNMFRGCLGLKTLPNNLLPATTLAEYCYYSLFRECNGLKTLPKNLLPATALAEYCYYCMFQDSNGLKTLPKNLLPATALIQQCYRLMFQNCTSLTTLPENLLADAALADNCYYGLFRNCTSLMDIGTINTAWFSERSGNRQAEMFNNCTNVTIPITYSDIPEGWK